MKYNAVPADMPEPATNIGPKGPSRTLTTLPLLAACADDPTTLRTETAVSTVIAPTIAAHLCIDALFFIDALLAQRVDRHVEVLCECSRQRVRPPRWLAHGSHFVEVPPR